MPRCRSVSTWDQYNQGGLVTWLTDGLPESQGRWGHSEGLRPTYPEKMILLMRLRKIDGGSNTQKVYKDKCFCKLYEKVVFQPKCSQAGSSTRRCTALLLLLSEPGSFGSIFLQNSNTNALTFNQSYSSYICFKILVLASGQKIKEFGDLEL